MAIVRAQNARPVLTRGWDLSSPGGLFEEFNQLFEQLGAPAFGSGQLSNSYPADLFETGDNVVLEMAVPGVQVQDLDVSIAGNSAGP